MVTDVTASNNATYLGVANQSNVYMGAFGASSGVQADSDKSMIAGLSYYYRQYGVAQFNMSFFSRLVTDFDVQGHTGAITKLNAAGSTTNITTNPFDFTGQPALPAIDQIDFTMYMNDGDTAAADFDFNNLVPAVGQLCYAAETQRFCEQSVFWLQLPLRSQQCSINRPAGRNGGQQIGGQDSASR